MAGENTIWKVSIVGRFGLGQTFVNTMHYRQLGEIVGISPAELLANDVSDKVTELYVGLIPASAQVDAIEVRQITDPPLAGFDLPMSVNGGQSGNQLPPQCAGLISWRTGMIGRNQRGRIYLPAPVESLNDAGQVAVSLQDAYADFATAMLTQPDVTGLIDAFNLCILHRETLTSDDVTSFVIRNDFKTQRRRVVGVGA